MTSPPQLLIAYALLAFVTQPAAPTVQEGPPIFTQKHPFDCSEAAEVKAGTLELSCAAKGNPQPNITWMNFGDAIFPRAGEIVEYGEWSLVLRNVTSSDKGLYECRVCNDFGCIQYRYTVNLKEPIKAKVDSDLNLPCDLEGANILWRKIDDLGCFASVADKEDTKLRSAEKKIPTFDKLSYSDSGIYVCSNGSAYSSESLLVVSNLHENTTYEDRRPVWKSTGESVTLSCAWRNADVTWSKNGEILEDKTNSSLELANLTRDDAGLYKCEVSYYSNYKEYYFILIVDTIFKKGSFQNVYANGVFYPNCANEFSDYNITYTVEYYNSDSAYDICAGVTKLNYSSTFSRIQRFNTTTYYNCAVKSVYGQYVRSEYVRYPSKGEPVFISSDYDISEVFEQNEGNNVTLSCNAAQEPNITWTKNGKPLELGNNLITSSTPYLITLTNLQKNDSGEYSCKLCNSNGCIERIYWMLVENNETSQNLSVQENSELLLTCIEEYYPFVTRIEWFKSDGNTTSPVNRFLSLGYVKNHNVLRFKSVQLSDAAKYTCKVYTHEVIGREYEQNFNLQVESIPFVQDEFVNYLIPAVIIASIIVGLLLIVFIIIIYLNQNKNLSANITPSDRLLKNNYEMTTTTASSNPRI